MYGMVNKAIVKYISTKYGAETWENIKRRAELVDDNFINMEQYDDRVSVAMVVSAANAVGKTPAQILEEVGEYWIQFALDSDYGELLRNAGDTLPELLMNLDNMHVRVGYSFSELKPPSFWCTDIGESSLTLHYVSEREGLTPMVSGLVRGLARMLQFECTVEQKVFKTDGHDHDEFYVTFANPVHTL